MDPYINIAEPILVNRMNNVEKFLEDNHPDYANYAREQRRKECKGICCVLICFIIILVLYYGLDFYFSTS